MLKKILNIIFILSCAAIIPMLTSCYNLTVEVGKLPANTPPGDPVYITGNFNNWDPGDARYRLTLREDSVYEVQLPVGFGELEYKFTRGDWTTVEKDPCGFEIENHQVIYGNAKVVRDTIRSWNDLPNLDCPRVTIIINRMPEITPPDSRIVFAGTANAWDPAGEEWEFWKDTLTGRYMLTVPRLGEQREMDFKVTRGNLTRVESDEMGGEIQARQLSFGEADSVFIEVKGWEDLSKDRRNLLTVVVTKVPPNTPVNDAIYIVGDFNDWYPRQASMILEKNGKGQYFINLPRRGTGMEFKFTRGDWSTVEVDRWGFEINNRVFRYDKRDTLYVKIEHWRDLSTESGPPVRVVIEKLPEGTPADDKIYIAGNFNNWDSGDRRWMMKKDAGGSYSIEIPRWRNNLDFKITRGSWRTAECDSVGDDIENRSYEYKDVEEIRIDVVRWKDR